MWKILNKLFGWHYVWIHDCSDHHVCRVSMTNDGLLIGKIASRYFYINRSGQIWGAYDIREWKPLTWTQSNCEVLAEMKI